MVPSIHLTQKAAEYIQTLLGRRGKGLGIRIKVQTSGCSGLGYQLEFADFAAYGELEIISKGVHIFLDPSQCQWLEGLHLDFIQQGLNEGFAFTNPSAKGSCRCGKSFSF